MLMLTPFLLLVSCAPALLYSLCLLAGHEPQNLRCRQYIMMAQQALSRTDKAVSCVMA